MKSIHLMSLILLVSGATACEDPVTLPSGGWGRLVKMLDGPSVYDRPGAEDDVVRGPRLERGAAVYAKVVIGGADLRSADPEIFTVDDVEVREVGEICESDGECRTDYDTWFTLTGHSVGEADLIVEGPGGDERRLPLSVGEFSSAQIAYVLPQDQFRDSHSDRPACAQLGDPLSEIVVDGALSFEYEWIRFEWLALLVCDDTGTRLLTHATWRLDSDEDAQFINAAPGAIFFDIPPDDTADSFIDFAPDRLEGPYPFLWPVRMGTATLFVETTGGFETSIPVTVTAELGPY
jgi:hypothetical protein